MLVHIFVYLKKPILPIILNKEIDQPSSVETMISYCIAGIQDAFCRVASDLIHLYEEVPNSGLQVLDSIGSPLPKDNVVLKDNSASSRNSNSESQDVATPHSGGCC